MESKLRLRLGPDRKRAFLGQIRADCHVPPPPPHTHTPCTRDCGQRAGRRRRDLHSRPRDELRRRRHWAGRDKGTLGGEAERARVELGAESRVRAGSRGLSTRHALLSRGAERPAG